MLNITNHWRNEKQSYNEIPHPLGWPVFKKKKKPENRFGQGCGETGRFVHCQQECNGTATVANSMAVPQKIKDRITI